jgi:cyclase
MPLAYGGGVRTVEDAAALFSCGVEKVVVNSAAVTGRELIPALANRFGTQSIVVCIDCKRDWLGRQRTFIHGGRRNTGMAPLEHAREMQARGAGELIIQSIERDGSQTGYDLGLIRSIASATSVPVIACGGAGQIEDFRDAIAAGASAVAAGSLFVFHGKRQAVLITYPPRSELEAMFPYAS